ncbi:MAG: dienelactone hydrolase family protein [Bacteroidota bacterium]
MRTIHYLAIFFFCSCLWACQSGDSTANEQQDATSEETATPEQSESRVKGREISYTKDSLTMKGYIAYNDSTSERRPGILVVHEWWGHNDYARKRADMLAEMGYVALAVDMYGDGKTAAHPDDAGKFAGMVMSNMEEARARFDKAMETLKQDPRTDPEKIGAIGYCFGGGVVLNMALQGADLDAVVSFHGSLPTPESVDGSQVKANMLVCHGADDPFIPAEKVEQFRKLMDEGGVSMTFNAYEGATHSFTNPDADENGKKFELPLAYNEQADKESWDNMSVFLKAIFQ